MSKLTTNFSSEEFMCTCGCKKSFVEPRLVNALQELRDLLNAPIKILSGYRCIKNNSEAGGGKNSQHLYGKAADITATLSYLSSPVKDLYEAALKVEAFANGGIGIYPDNNFIHVDVRNTKARWARVKKSKKDIYVSLEEGLKKC